MGAGGARETSNTFAEDTSDPVSLYLQERGGVEAQPRAGVEIPADRGKEKQVREHVLSHPFLIRSARVAAV